MDPHIPFVIIGLQNTPLRTHYVYDSTRVIGRGEPKANNHWQPLACANCYYQVILASNDRGTTTQGS